MINIYIKELENEEEIIIPYRVPKWIENFVKKLIKKFNYIMDKKVDENKKIYLLPNIKEEKVYKRIKKKLEKEKTQTQKLQIILSNKVKKYESYFKNYKIVEGANIFLNLVENILKKILKENPLELQDIYILTNKYNERSYSLIKRISKEVKTVNIITKEIQKYKNIEEIMQDEGIIIYVSNNKKKSLKRGKIIINLDFTKEEISQYNIFRNAIILNLTKNKITNLKGFEGIIVQDFDIELEKEEKKWIDKNNLNRAFRQIEIYESIQKGKNKKDIIISNLYGNNGKIEEKELLNMQKILTNVKI